MYYFVHFTCVKTKGQKTNCSECSRWQENRSQETQSTTIRCCRYEYFIQKLYLNQGTGALCDDFHGANSLFIEIKTLAGECHGLLGAMCSYLIQKKQKLGREQTENSAFSNLVQMCNQGIVNNPMKEQGLSPLECLKSPLHVACTESNVSHCFHGNYNKYIEHNNCIQ